MNKCARCFASMCLAAILVSCRGLPTSQASLGGAKLTQAVTGGPAVPTAIRSAGTAVPQATLVPIPASGTPVPPNTQPNPSPSAQLDCERAAAGSPIDLSVPDNTLFEPGQSFTKIWRLRNASSCTWSVDYAAIWFSGEKFGAPYAVSLSGDVLPGESADISVDMIAPQEPGTYQSNWKLKGPDGNLFGIGPSGDSPFWVRIIVSQPQGTAEVNAITPTASPQVYATGLANLTIDDGLDLDLLKLNQGDTDDLLYRLVAQKHLQLVPQNGARLALAGKSQPDLSGCQAARLENEAQPLDGLASGTYFCYKTNLGLPGWARIVYLNPKDDVLTLEILTWSTP